MLVGTYTQTRHRLLNAPAEHKSIVTVALNHSRQHPGDVTASKIRSHCSILLHHPVYFEKLFASNPRLEAAAGEHGGTAADSVADGQAEIEPPLLDVSAELSKIFQTAWFEALGLAVTTANVVAMVLDGSLSAAQDSQLELVERYCAFFFLAEFAVLVLCAASVAAHFRRSALAVFDFSILCCTTTALIADALGVPGNTVSVIRAPAMFRLVRFAKFGARWRSLEPVWAVFRDFGLSLVPLANSALFFLVVAWCVLVFFVQCLPGRIFTIGADGGVPDPGAPSALKPRSMLVFTLPLFTGTSWADATLSAMEQGCDIITDQCDQGRAFFFAIAFVIFYWLTQFICIPFLLALVLENFGLCKILASSIPDKKSSIELNWAQARAAMAAYYFLPTEAVAKSLVDRALTELRRDLADPRVLQTELHNWMLFRRPQRMWRLAKWMGLIRFRSFLRRRICTCFKTWFPPYPGDVDWVAGSARRGSQLTKEELAQRREEKQRKRLEEAAPKLRELMTKLVKQGMAGEVRIVAARMNLSSDLPSSVIDADPAVAFKLLQDPFLAKRLGIQLAGAADAINEIHSEIQDLDKDERPRSMGDSGELVKSGQQVKPDSWMFRLRKSMSRPFRSMVTSPVFEAVNFVCIFLSCIFMFCETPASEIDPVIPREVMDIAGFIFLLIFTIEAAAKILGFGLIYSVSWSQKPYIYQFWNRVDGVILIVNWLQYLGYLNVAEKYTTQVLRLTRGVKLLQLLQYSSIKSMADSLAASFKPLLLVVVCLVCFISIFGVLGMALFRLTFAYCTDLSIDGTLSEGQKECTGVFMNPESGLFSPRKWDNPSSNFDTCLGSIMTLCGVYSSSWIFSLYSAEDSNKANPGIQPIENQNAPVAIIFFSVFVLCIRLFLTSNIFVMLNLIAADFFFLPEQILYMQSLLNLSFAQMLRMVTFK